MKLLVLIALCVAPSLGAKMPYVVGGIQVDTATQYPFMATLMRGNTAVCGGALIASQWVVTAAHCLGSRIDQVAFGKLSISDDNIGSPEYYTPMGNMRHADFVKDDSIGNPNDIGLLKLGTAVKLSDTAAVIPLADDTMTFTDCVIMGWGHTKSGVLPGPLPDRLQHADVTIFSQEFCKGRWSPDQILDTHLCAGVTGLVSACTNDGGGALACKVGGDYTLAGVMSFTQFTCGPGTPSVFTDISRYRDWLTTNSCGAV